MTNKRIAVLGCGGVSSGKRLAMFVERLSAVHLPVEPTSNEDWKANLKRHSKKGKNRNVK